MTDQEVLTIFTQVLRDLLANDLIVLQMSTTRADVSDWDSFMYVNFIVAVEIDLGIRFTVADVEAFETVGEIVAEARRLQAEKPKL